MFNSLLCFPLISVSLPYRDLTEKCPRLHTIIGLVTNDIALVTHVGRGLTIGKTLFVFHHIYCHLELHFFLISDVKSKYVYLYYRWHVHLVGNTIYSPLDRTQSREQDSATVEHHICHPFAR